MNIAKPKINIKTINIVGECLHPILQLAGMAFVLTGFIVLQIFIVLFAVVKKMGGQVDRKAVYCVLAVAGALFIVGYIFIYL